MKFVKRICGIVIVIQMILCCLVINALADTTSETVTAEESGLYVTLSTDKDNYEKTDDVYATITLRSLDNSVMRNIVIRNVTSEDFPLNIQQIGQMEEDAADYDDDSGEARMTEIPIKSLKRNNAVSSSTVATKTEMSNTVTQALEDDINTDESQNMLNVWNILLIGLLSVIGIVSLLICIILMVRRKNIKRIVWIILCVFISSILLNNIDVYAASVKAEHKTLDISKRIQVENQTYELSYKISWDNVIREDESTTEEIIEETQTEPETEKIETTVVTTQETTTVETAAETTTVITATETEPPTTTTAEPTTTTLTQDDTTMQPVTESTVEITEETSTTQTQSETSTPTESDAPPETETSASKQNVVLGTFTTSLADATENKRHNIAVAAQKINGHTYAPGETISALALMSPVTEAGGYAMGLAYIDGKVADSMGGGICQVSTTLYNAGLLAELQIGARRNHSMTVSYVPYAQDATVFADSNLDFTMVNNKNYPITLEACTDGSQLTITIYGVEERPANRTIKYVSETISEEYPPMPNCSTVVDPSMEPGQYEVVQIVYPKVVANLWKEVYIDGVMTERTLVNTSAYRASNGTMKVGPNTELTYDERGHVVAVNVTE